ncbi:MAG: proline--tRNA ligase [Candidatus Woesearchaeota archaeon]
MEKFKKGLSAKKNEDFSVWFSEIVQKAELADLRYNVKGFLVFQPWSVIVMEKMYAQLEKVLQRKGHMPYYFPTLIPEKNLLKEKEHVQGFVPEVFWVTEAGDKKLDERLALRPTSETAFYQMFNQWIRSYRDLPFKTYQRANIFRYETKATRPFMRSREFYWIETHCAHRSLKDAEAQVREDMETTEEVLHKQFGLPFMFFERPSWDKFPGAARTFAADVLNPDGKVIQQPSTHLLSQKFAEGFDVKFKDENGEDKLVWLSCYGPAVSRIFASIVITHGDDKGLKFPWEIAPLQVVIVPISDDKKVIKKAEELKKKIGEVASVSIDDSDKTPGEKFNYWEMKGVPVRIDLGEKEIKSGKLSVFRRDLDKKDSVAEKDLMKHIEKVAKETTANLIKKADKVFKSRSVDAGNLAEMKKAIEKGAIVRCNFCSVDSDGEKCAGVVEKEVGAKVRGTKLKKEVVNGKCVVCKENAGEVVYVARDY